MLHRFAGDKLATLHHAGMYPGIEDGQVIFGKDTLQRSAIGGIAGGVDNGMFLSEKARDLLLQPGMIIIMAADGGGRTGTIFKDTVNIQDSCFRSKKAGYDL